MEFLLSKFQEDGILNCLICLETVSRARICRYCSKLFCNDCIKGWMHNTSFSCPNCLHRIYESDLVNCRWMNEITDFVDKIDEEIKEVQDAKSEIIRVCRGKCGFCRNCHYESELSKLREEIEKVMAERDILLVEKEQVKEERKTLQQQIEKNRQAGEILDVDRQIFIEEKAAHEAAKKREIGRRKDLLGDNLFSGFLQITLEDSEESEEEVEIVEIVSSDNSEYIDLDDNDFRLSAKVLLPTASILGRFIGAGGRTIKHLEQVTKCTLAVNGKGVISPEYGDKSKINSPLHVEIKCQAPPEEAFQLIAGCVAQVRLVVCQLVRDISL